jgi:hypothetical protein
VEEGGHDQGEEGSPAKDEQNGAEDELETLG